MVRHSLMFLALLALLFGGGTPALAASFAYISNQFDGTVSVIDAATNTVTATVGVGLNPYGLAATPNGTRIYVANFGSNSVSVISTATNTVTATVGVGANPVAWGKFIGLFWHVVGVGDFNGDGSPDILWRSSSTGEVYAWFMTGPTHTGGQSLGYVTD